MYFRWTIFRLKLKAFIKMLPLIFLETVLFGCILIGIGAYATKAIYGEKKLGEIKVGIVAAKEEKTTDMLIRFVESMDSIRDTVSFVMLSEEEARDKLNAGEIYAAILVPEGVIDSILSGENIPATILLGNAYSKVETEVFAELTQAGAKLLTTAQAGIYAADDFCVEMGQKEKRKETEDYLNDAYISYALNRTSLFKEKQVNAVKGLNLTDYYCISLLLAFLSFAGISFGKYMQVDRGEWEKILESRGIWIGEQYFIESIAFASVFALLGTAISILVCLLVINKSKSSFELGTTWLMMLALWFVIGLFLRALLQLTGNQAGGIGVCFVIVMVLMLVAGVFVPRAFLPAWVEKAGSFFPYRDWMESMAAILQGRIDSGQVGRFALMAVFFLAIGICAVVCRNVRRD